MKLASLLLALLLTLTGHAHAAVIRASATTGGTIAPSGTVTVPDGNNQTFNITPSAGRVISDVRVDNLSVGAVSAYTFTSVTGSHTIKASFAYPTHPITVTAGPGGRITPSGTVAVRVGFSKRFVAVPARGMHAAIKLDGQIVAASARGTVSYTLANVQAPHTIEAVFLPSGTPFAQSINLSLTGLGESIKVANQSPGAFHGHAQSDLGIRSVKYYNEKNKRKGTAIGTTDWAANISLSRGDNRIRFTAEAGDGSKMEIITVLTYHPAADFTTPLTPSSTLLYVNESGALSFTIGLGGTSNAVVRLHRTDAKGKVLDTGVLMLDDGNLPDEIDSDGVFTGEIFADTATAAILNYRVGVTKGTTTYYSEVVQVWVANRLSSASVKDSVNLANSAVDLFQQGTNSGQSVANAISNLVNQFKQDPKVGVVGSSPGNGVWWVSQDGLLGAFHPEFPGQKVGAGVGVPPRGPAKVAVPTSPRSLPKSRYYAPRDLATLKVNSIPVADVPPKNEMKSKKAIIISPFINNPNSGSSFGTADDYYVPWLEVKNAGPNSCQLYAAREVLNNGSIEVSLDTFKQLGDYGAIHISSHGDNLYNGLFSLWQNVWGPNNFLLGSLSQVVILSGIYLPPDGNGGFDITGYEDDLIAKRLAITGSGCLAMLPGFFSHYLDGLPNSLVLLSSCRSTWNNSMANVFLSKGAGTVLGYTDYVSTSYAQNTLKKVYQEMYAAKTSGEAKASAVAAHGASDAVSNPADTDPAFFTLSGATDLVLPGGSLQNAGFEDGVLSPWSKEGDGRIITQLGSTQPTEGQFMAVISTGLGFTTASGSIEQDFCVSATATNLTLNWNFFSEEFLEYCNSQYQDYFTVTLCEIDEMTGLETCTEEFAVVIDDLCGSVFPSDVSFDRGGVYNTGWQNLSVNLVNYRGKHVRLRLSAGDVGDSIYDTAILIDNIVEHQ